jgi:hypothetical protein
MHLGIADARATGKGPVAPLTDRAIERIYSKCRIIAMAAGKAIFDNRVTQSTTSDATNIKA